MPNESQRTTGAPGPPPPAGGPGIPGNGTGAPDNGPDADDPQSPAHAFHSAARLLGELWAYARYYLAARIDSLKLTLRKAGIYAGLGGIAALIGGTLVVVATILLVLGVSNFINFLFALASPRLVPWIGQLLTGLLLLGGLGIGAWLGIRYFFKASRRRTVDQYERQRHQQRVEYGHDVQERARHG